MTNFADFLLWEATTRDTLDFKTIYVDMADDLMAGLLLSQIVYWHLPNKHGESKLRVEQDGEMWIAKGRADWWDEIRLKPRQVDRAMKILVERGLVTTGLYKFAGAPTTHIRLNQEAFLDLWQEIAGRSISRNGQMEFTDSLNPNSPNGEMELPQTGNSLTESTTETTTETTTTSPEPEPNAEDGDVVVSDNSVFSENLQALEAHGVSPTESARAVARHAEVTPVMIDAWAAHIGEKDGVKNAAGYLLSVLQTATGPPVNGNGNRRWSGVREGTWTEEELEKARREALAEPVLDVAVLLGTDDA